MKQKTLFKVSEYSSEFGGSLLKGKRKSARPMSTKLPLHSVMKSSSNFYRHAEFISKTIERFARRFQIKLHRKAIEANHIHLAISFDNKTAFQNFSRACAGTLAKKLKIKWLFRPYTKIVSLGREFKNLLEYIDRNCFEAAGIVEYKKRNRAKRTVGNSS